MTYQFKKLLLVFGFSIIFFSCKEAKKQATYKAIVKKDESCNCGNMEMLPPPPLVNVIIAKDTISVNNKNTSVLFTAKLIGDKTVDMEGKELALFKIKAAYQNEKETLGFALPTKYNKYWDRFHIYKDNEKKLFNIGFVNVDSNWIQLMYSVYLDTLPDNDVRIKIGFQEQKIIELTKPRL